MLILSNVFMTLACMDILNLKNKYPLGNVNCDEFSTLNK